MDEILDFLYSQPLRHPVLSEKDRGFSISVTADPIDHDLFDLDSQPNLSQKHEARWDADDLDQLSRNLRQHGIRAIKTNGRDFPPEAQMHDRAAVVPALVVSPRSEQEVALTLRFMKYLGLYGRLPLSVKSGGHGYFNGATCPGVMLNMSHMTERRIVDNTLFVEPGCNLGNTISILAKNRKALPHGDCFGVGVGGHFLTAGWDLILARRYGLGCQSVIGGRIVLWNGCVVDVDEENHPKLLHAMRGGAAAEVGVVTEIRLRLIDEPPRATWRSARITKRQLETCVAHNAFSRAENLPRDITVSFQFHFESGNNEPVCSFNVISLLTADETVQYLYQHLGDEVTSFIADTSLWHEKSLIDVRLMPASESLKRDPERLADVTAESLHANPLDYWSETHVKREMAPSFFTTISHWVKPNCENMFVDMYEAFESAKELAMRERMYALVIVGSGRMNELQDQCAMPLGKALARFELHWDDQEKEEEWARSFTSRMSGIFQSETDPTTTRTYRGDIWLPEQAKDAALDAIFQKYDRRFT